MFNQQKVKNGCNKYVGGIKLISYSITILTRLDPFKTSKGLFAYNMLRKINMYIKYRYFCLCHCVCT